MGDVRVDLFEAHTDTVEYGIDVHTALEELQGYACEVSLLQLVFLDIEGLLNTSRTVRAWAEVVQDSQNRVDFPQLAVVRICN